MDADVAATLAAMSVARLVHFTPARNLSKILRDGAIRSVTEMEADARAAFARTDLLRLDGHPDKISCSLQYPNGFYLDIARHKPDMVGYADWVFLLLDKQVAATVGTLFSTRNAAAGGAVPGVDGLTACYADQTVGQGGKLYMRGASHDPGSPTDVQAEVLVPSPIPLSAVYGIVFPSSEAAAEEEGRLERLSATVPATVRWIIAPGMFGKWSVSDAVTRSAYLTETDWTPGSATTR